MTPRDFIDKWKSGGDERRDAQSFFEDLCRLVGHPTPSGASDQSPIPITRERLLQIIDETHLLKGCGRESSEPCN